ncbi:MAG: response regulator [Lentimicrobium sp.]|nr:response regulator [Lentimicrobium sp.]
MADSKKYRKTVKPQANDEKVSSSLGDFSAFSDELLIKAFDLLNQACYLTDNNFFILRSNQFGDLLLENTSVTACGKSIFDLIKFRYINNPDELLKLVNNSPGSVSTFGQSSIFAHHFKIDISSIILHSDNYYLFQINPINNFSAEPVYVDLDISSGSEDRTFLSAGPQEFSNFDAENSFLRTIIDSLPHPFYVMEAGTEKSLLKNQAAVKFEKSLESVHCFMKEKPESCFGNPYTCALSMVISSTTPVRIEHEFVIKTGEKRIHEVFGYPVFNNHGSLQFVIQYSIDITERKRNELEIQEYQSVLNNLMNNLPGMAFRCLNEANWTMEYVSPGSKKLTGFSANELINNKKIHFGDLILESDRKGVWNGIQNALGRNRPYKLEYRILTKNGKIKWVLEQGRGVFDQHGKLVRLEGMVTDITEGKNAELQLKNELTINQSIATIGLELLKDDVKPARVANLVQHYSRLFTGSEFSILISPSSLEQASFLYCYEEDGESKSSKRIKKHEQKDDTPVSLIDTLLESKQPVLINESGIKLKIPCVTKGEVTVNKLLSVPAFINNEYAGLIILADAENDYTEEMAGVVQRLINMFSLYAFRLKAEESLQIAKQKAEESDRLKSLFLSNMSHEIRTPMNAIIGFAEMLQDRELNIEEKDRFLDVIIKSGDNLLRLINDIIDISKIEAGQLKIIYSDCYLNEMFTDLEISFNRELTRMRKDHLKLYVQPGNSDSDFAVYTDPVRLRQIITNLFGNAIKFTDEGFIEIGYRIKADKIEFYVRDSGIGIPVDHQKLIFERFGQVKEAAARNLAGTGLGLTISKNLVEMLGGRMWLDSFPGEGSTFWFTIPLKFGRHRLIAEEESDGFPQQQLDLTGKCFLVVEDVDTNYFYISSLLGKLNGKVIRATDGIKAIEISRNDPSVNVVLMDIELPIMDGYTATREIKKIRPELPVIAQTAFAMIGERERSQEAGCDDYISKPIRKEILLEVISRFI